MAGDALFMTDGLIVRCFEADDISASYIGWLNDPETMRYSEQRHRRHTAQSCAAYLASFSDTGNLFLSVLRRGATPRRIGTATIYVDRPNAVGDIGILIGDSACRGVGLGGELWGALIGFAFRELGLRKVTAGTAAVNAPMLALFRKSGMIEEGRRRGQLLWSGQPTDLVYAGIFRDEWPPPGEC